MGSFYFIGLCRKGEKSAVVHHSPQGEDVSWWVCKLLKIEYRSDKRRE